MTSDVTFFAAVLLLLACVIAIFGLIGIIYQCSMWSRLNTHHECKKRPLPTVDITTASVWSGMGVHFQNALRQHRWQAHPGIANGKHEKGKSNLFAHRVNVNMNVHQTPIRSMKTKSKPSRVHPNHVKPQNKSLKSGKEYETQVLQMVVPISDGHATKGKMTLRRLLSDVSYISRSSKLNGSSFTRADSIMSGASIQSKNPL